MEQRQEKQTSLELSLPVCTSAGVLTFLLSVGMHLRYYWAQVKRRQRNLPVHFPGQARQ